MAWRYGGEDPWRMHNLLGPDYRPIGKPDAAPVLPEHPERFQAFMYACARVAGIIEKKMKDAPYMPVLPARSTRTGARTAPSLRT